MLAVWTWVGTVHNLAWSMRITYVFLGMAAWFNFQQALQPAIDSPWRKMYFYKGIVSFVAWLWYSALLLGLLGATDFVFAIRWLQPLVVTGLFTSALLHKWEIKSLKEKKRQEEKIKQMIEDRERE